MSLELRIVSANLQHWIKSGGIMIDGKKRTEKDYKSKLNWAQQRFASLQPHIIGLQEIYDQESVEAIFSHPDLASKHYHCHLSGGAPQQVGLATTLDVDGPIETIQVLQDPICINRADCDISVTKLSRPILKARLIHEGGVVTVFVAHLKSKIPSFGDDPRVVAPEQDLLTADLAKRSLGSLLSLVRRGAEAAALRREIVHELEKSPDNPVIVLGDLNDGPDAVTTEMISGDRVSTYIAHPEEGKSYTKEEVAKIRRRLHRTVLTSAQEVQVKSVAINEFYTSIHNGKYSSLDHIFLSRHFFRAPTAVEDSDFVQKYFFNYFEVLNDHLVDRETVFAPYKPMTTDHGLAIAYLKKRTIAERSPEATAVSAAPRAPKDAVEMPSDLEIR